MDSDFTGPKYFGNPDCELSISKQARNIKKKFNFNLEIRNRDLFKNYANKLKPYLTKLNNIHNWELSNNLEQGSNKTKENFKLKI